MIGALTDGLRTLIAGTFFVSLALALSPEGKSRSALRFTAGTLMTLLLLRPVLTLRTVSTAEAWSMERIEAAAIADARENAEEIYNSFIRRETEEYIWNAAAELGIEAPGVRVTLKTDGACPYPWEIALRGDMTGEQQDTLSALLAAELGVPAQRQHWSRSDAD